MAKNCYFTGLKFITLVSALFASVSYSAFAFAQVEQSRQAQHLFAESDWLPLFGPMQINGRQILVQATQTHLSPNHLLVNLKREWEQKGFRVQESSSGDWKILSRIVGPHIEFIQVRAGSFGSELLRHRAHLHEGQSPLPKPDWLGSVGRVVFVSDSKSSVEKGTSWLLELLQGDSFDVLVSQLTRLGYQEYPLAQRISHYQIQRLGLSLNSSSSPVPSAPRVLTKAGRSELYLQHYFDRGRSLVLVNEIQPLSKEQKTP